MSTRKEIRKTKRPCAAVKGVVVLTAHLEVFYQGRPPQESFRDVLRWTSCTKKDECGKKCNYFFGSDDADFHAGNASEF